MKKKLLVIICMLLILVGCNKDKEEEPTNQEQQPTLTETLNYDNNVVKESSLTTLTITDYEYTDFTIQVMGLYQKVINKETLNDIAKYSFVLNNLYKGKNIELNYEGIYFQEVIKKLEIEEYTKVMFTDKSGNTVTVRKEDLKDTLLIFRSNEKDLNEWGPAKIVITTYDMSTWLESVISVTFK